MGETRSIPATVRFLHTAELRLGIPPRVRGGLPPRIADRLLEAPRETLARIAALAEREDVDCVICAGNMLDSGQALPADLDAWEATCHRLAERNIPLIWHWAECEQKTAWIGEIPLSEQVHVFHQQTFMEEEIATPRGTVHVLVWPGMPAGTETQGLTLPPRGSAIVLGLLAQGARPPGVIGVHYWAGCGKARTTETLPHTVVHVPGEPLPRGFRREGPGGVTLGERDAQGRITLREVSVAAVRFATITLYLAEDTTWNALSAQVIQQCESWRVASDADWLVQIVLQGAADILVQWKAKNLGEELLQLIRGRYADASPFIWPTEVSYDPLELAPEKWLREKGFRGEFLRQALEVQRALASGDIGVLSPSELAAFASDSEQPFGGNTELAQQAGLPWQAYREKSAEQTSPLAEVAEGTSPIAETAERIPEANRPDGMDQVAAIEEDLRQAVLAGLELLFQSTLSSGG